MLIKAIILLFVFSLSFALASDCDPGHHWVKRYVRKSYVRSDGVSVSATEVKAHCRKTSEIYKLWNTKLKNAPPRWPRKQEIFQAWNDRERQLLMEALESLPDALLREKIEGIFRAKKSKDYPNPATSMDKVIVLYDSAFELKYEIQRILGHELAHQLYLDLTMEEIKDYQVMMNWFPIDDKGSRFISRKDGFVQDDGRESPEEDFANNIEFYLNEPEKLKKITPNAYGWIKKRFGDKFIISRGASKK